MCIISEASILLSVIKLLPLKKLQCDVTDNVIVIMQVISMQFYFCHPLSCFHYHICVTLSIVYNGNLSDQFTASVDCLTFWVIAGVEGALLLLVSSISDEVTGTTWVASCG